MLERLQEVEHQKPLDPNLPKFRFGEVSGLGTEMKVSTQKKVSLGIQSPSENVIMLRR